MSIRVGDEIRTWLDRRSLGRGSGASAAVRLLEEVRRREQFPAVEFRDTPLGRLAYVQETRVALVLLAKMASSQSAEQIARHYRWPLWKAESALGYLRAFPEEMAKEIATFEEFEEKELSNRLPAMESISVV